VESLANALFTVLAPSPRHVTASVGAAKPQQPMQRVQTAFSVAAAVPARLIIGSVTNSACVMRGMAVRMTTIIAVIQKGVR